MDRRKAYIKSIMEQNSKNPNISPVQHEFLKDLAKYRHEIHAHSHQYFLSEVKAIDIDCFFAVAHSMEFFNNIDLPYPEKMLNIFDQLKEDKQYQYVSFDEAVSRFANTKEALNTEIENYLKSIDVDKGTKYCPSGMYRDGEDPYVKTVNQINAAYYQVKPYKEKIQKELDKISEDIENDMDSGEKAKMKLDSDLGFF